MVKFTNNHSINNVLVTDKDGKVRTLAPGESCELFDKETAIKKGVEASVNIGAAAKAKAEASKEQKEDK